MRGLAFEPAAFFVRPVVISAMAIPSFLVLSRIWLEFS